MVSCITGVLLETHEGRAQLEMGPMVLDVHFPASDLGRLVALKGQSVTFYTILYLEGDPTRGNLEPKLLGFLEPSSREFFGKFTTVKGIGPRKALKAMALPVGQIASAIESRDTRVLVSLPEIGKRLAETVVAQLTGKVAEFVTGPGGKPSPTISLNPAEADAVDGLVTLGEKRADAERLLDRIRKSGASYSSADELLKLLLRERRT